MGHGTPRFTLPLRAMAQPAVGNQPGNMGLQKGAPQLGEEGTTRTHRAPTGTAASSQPQPLPQKCLSMLSGTAGLMSLCPGRFPTRVSLPLSLLPSPPPSTAPFPGISGRRLVLHPTEVCTHGTLPSQQPGSCRDVPSLARDSREEGLSSCCRGCFTALRSPCSPLLSSGTASRASTRSPSPEPCWLLFCCPEPPGWRAAAGSLPFRAAQSPRCNSWETPPLSFLQASPAQPPAWSLLGAAQTPLSASSSPLKIPFPEEPCEAPQVFGFTYMFIMNLSHD